MRWLMALAVLASLSTFFVSGAAMDPDADLTTSDAVVCVLEAEVSLETEAEAAEDEPVPEAAAARFLHLPVVAYRRRHDLWTILFRRWHRSFRGDIPV